MLQKDRIDRCKEANAAGSRGSKALLGGRLVNANTCNPFVSGRPENLNHGPQPDLWSPLRQAAARICKFRCRIALYSLWRATYDVRTCRKTALLARRPATKLISCVAFATVPAGTSKQKIQKTTAPRHHAVHSVSFWTARLDSNRWQVNEGILQRARSLFFCPVSAWIEVQMHDAQ